MVYQAILWISLIVSGLILLLGGIILALEVVTLLKNPDKKRHGK